VQQAILEAYPDFDLKVLIVWIKMYAAESIEVAQEAAKLFGGDARVVQFYDPAKLTVYLFYDGEAKWGEQFPQPTEWAHQLGRSSWADSGRFHPGDELYQELQDIMQDLLRGRKDA
jgi:hypothetical protein